MTIILAPFLPSLTLLGAEIQEPGPKQEESTNVVHGLLPTSIQEFNTHFVMHGTLPNMLSNAMHSLISARNTSMSNAIKSHVHPIHKQSQTSQIVIIVKLGQEVQGGEHHREVGEGGENQCQARGDGEGEEIQILKAWL